MSRLNCGVPIYALTSPDRHALPLRAAARRLPADGEVRRPDREELLREAEKVLVETTW